MSGGGEAGWGLAELVTHAPSFSLQLQPLCPENGRWLGPELQLIHSDAYQGGAFVCQALSQAGMLCDSPTAWRPPLPDAAGPSGEASLTSVFLPLARRSQGPE